MVLIPLSLGVSANAVESQLSARISLLSSAKPAFLPPSTADSISHPNQGPTIDQFQLNGRDPKPIELPSHFHSSSGLAAGSHWACSASSLICPDQGVIPTNETLALPSFSGKVSLGRLPQDSLLNDSAPDFTTGIQLSEKQSTPLTSTPDADALKTARLETALQAPAPQALEPWQFRGNGGQGVKTSLSEAHVLEINPHWLSFGMFDSMNLDMTDKPPGPGESEPQEWRSTFTVGLATDWHLTRTVALHAGYRYYDNPVPNHVTSGAFLNANQHVMATAVSFRQGPHSMALAYGLDVLDAGSSSGISSARQGENLDSLAHLVTFSYGYSF